MALTVTTEFNALVLVAVLVSVVSLNITNGNNNNNNNNFYKLLLLRPEGRGFDSRWCNWNFSLT